MEFLIKKYCRDTRCRVKTKQAIDNVLSPLRICYEAKQRSFINETAMRNINGASRMGFDPVTAAVCVLPWRRRCCVRAPP